MSHLGTLRFGIKLLWKTIACQLKGQKRTLILSKVFCAKHQTMQDIRNKLIKILDIDTDYSKSPKSRDHLMQYLPHKQEDLPARTMKDSFDSAIVPLSSDSKLRDKYTTSFKNVRLGRLMEDMDMFAVWCSTKHLNSNDGKPFPFIIVTVRIDEIAFSKHAIQTTADVRLSGHVCWVGKSSLEVMVWLDQKINGNWIRITKALLLMAARNPLNTGPGIVNPIIPENPEEQCLFDGGENRKKRRLQDMETSLLKTVPTEEELNLIHNLFIKTIDPQKQFLDSKMLPPGGKWMHDTTLNTLVFCHPEHRNLHNKIFGGFLIRQALELSWVTGFLHGLRVPQLVHISDIGFYNPVEVGSIAKFYANITYTTEEYIQIFVLAEALTISDIKGRSTTGFNFTYKLGKPVDQVYPSTYLEAMKYIDGRRHFNSVMESSLKEIENFSRNS